MNPENENLENENVDYINAINELKANTVDKKAYDKLKAENKQLLDTLVNNGQLSTESAGSKESAEDLRKELFGSKPLTNLDYVKKALELRETVMDEGGRDPFIPSGTHAKVDDYDIATAEKVATMLQEIVDYSNGDPEVFTMELQRRTIDTQPSYRK